MKSWLKAVNFTANSVHSKNDLDKKKSHGLLKQSLGIFMLTKELL